MSEEDSRRTTTGGSRKPDNGRSGQAGRGSSASSAAASPRPGYGYPHPFRDPHDMMVPKQSYNVLDIKRTDLLYRHAVSSNSITTASHDPIR
jgi:hypothetical protein